MLTDLAKTSGALAQLVNGGKARGLEGATASPILYYEAVAVLLSDLQAA